MSNAIKYKDAPAKVEESLEHAIVVNDFLPSPDELIRKTEKEKITIAIDKHSLDLFKQYAKEHNARYQLMMNEVLGSYASKFLSHR